MTHPCSHYSCMENYHGECYGMGCRLNPMPEPEYDGDGYGDGGVWDLSATGAKFTEIPNDRVAARDIIIDHLYDTPF